MNIGSYIKNEISKWPNWINLILLKMNCFGGMVYGLSYRKIKAHLSDYNPEELLLKSVNYAIKHVPYYRERYEGITLHSLSEFEEKIGFIDKDEVMAHWDNFIVDNIDWSKVSKGTTGGTSGKPLKLVMPNNRYSWELAYMHKIWEKAGWHYHIRGVIRNHDLRGRDYAINPVLKEVIFDPNRISEEYVNKIYKLLKRFHICFIHAYPSNAYQFCKLCLRQNLDISFIHAFLCGSEGVTEEQRSFFMNHRIKVLTFYGHSEKLILGSNDTNSWDITIEPNYGYCELIGQNNKCIKTLDETGELTGTTFNNRYFPLIRYKTGDFATLEKLGNNMVLSNVMGRWNKSLIYKNDGTFTSITILNLHGDFYEHIDGMQYIQEKKGYVRVLIIKNDQYSQDDEAFILNHIGNAMGGAEFVQIEYVKKLIIQSNGKFLPLISKI